MPARSTARAKSRKKAPSGRESLRPSEQLRLRAAHGIVARDLPRIAQLYGSNVVGMGIGLRTSGAEQRVVPELVIKVYVETKVGPKSDLPGRGGAKGPRRVPRALSISIEGQKVVVPTDVVRAGRPVPTAAVGAGIAMELNGAVQANGSICCLLREVAGAMPGALYLLSCKHLFGLPELSTSCAGVSGARVLVPGGTGAAAEVQSGEFLSSWVAPPAVSLDAAIALVRSESSVSSRIGGARATAVAPFEDLIPGHTVELVSGARRAVGTILNLVHGVRFNRSFHCGGALADLQFERLIEYRVSSGTFPGESGGGVYVDLDGGDDGMLAGMHFLYEVATGNSFAQYVGDVLRPGLFAGKTLALESAWRV